jgi:kynureninase
VPSASPADPSAQLASHYRRFKVGERLLFTGHSHQAWPDVAFDAQQQAWLDAADLVDAKWEKAEAVANDVRCGFRRLLRDDEGDIALGANTHELIVRWLSAILPMFGSAAASRATVVTTDGEFHTIRRQLDRLAEEGVIVTRVAAAPADTLAERLVRSIGESTSAVLVSSVLFETAEIVEGLDRLAAACVQASVPLLVDAYHHLNVVPFDLGALGLERAFIVGGGYKYCQLGEGNCFLRVPPDCELRPVITGWFSEFGELAHARRTGDVPYARGPARFAGATYDPTSHYRAARVFAFHEEMGLTPEALRGISQRQVARLIDGFTALDVDPSLAQVVSIPADRRAGFVAIQSPRAADLVAALRTRGLWADARGETLRLGPAPYVSDPQIDIAVEILGESLREIASEHGST